MNVVKFNDVCSCVVQLLLLALWTLYCCKFCSTNVICVRFIFFQMIFFYDSIHDCVSRVVWLLAATLCPRMVVAGVHCLSRCLSNVTMSKRMVHRLYGNPFVFWWFLCVCVFWLCPSIKTEQKNSSWSAMCCIIFVFRSPFVSHHIWKIFTYKSQTNRNEEGKKTTNENDRILYLCSRTLYTIHLCRYCLLFVICVIICLNFFFFFFFSLMHTE